MDRLKEVIANTHVVAHDEDFGPLLNTLRREGFHPQISVMDYSEAERSYARIVRCLLNHIRVWEKCRKHAGLSLVVEADFVPIRGFGKRPLPFHIDRPEGVFAYLYACGPTLYRLDPCSSGQGQAASTVAYVLDRIAADCLFCFGRQELEKGSPKNYRPWDTNLRTYLCDRGIKTFLPYRNYGEHGGIGNPEHRGRVSPPTHRADVLWGRLAFLPQYADNSRLRFLWVRLLAKLRGLARLFLGRYLPRPIWQHIIHRPDMLWYAIRRHLSVSW